MKSGGAVAPAPLAGAPRRGWRIGRLDLYLARGAAGPFLLVLPTVIVALMLERALRLVREMAATGADLDFFLPMLARLLPYYLELSIPLAFLTVLVLLVARLDQYLEFEALLASGISLARIAAPLVALGLLLAGLSLWAGGWLEPLGRYEFRQMRSEAINSGRISSLEPGALFQPGNNLVVTFDEQRADGSLGGVFLWQRLESGEELVASGASGRIVFSRAGRLFGVDFSDGRYVSGIAQAAPTTVDFAHLSIREPLIPRDVSWDRGWDHNELTLPELAQEARLGTRGLSRQVVEAEFYSRIGRAAIVPLIPLLVLSLAFATKQRGRALGVVACVALVVVANHGLNLARSLALTGVGTPSVLIPAAAGAVWLLALTLFVSSRRLPGYSPVNALLDRISAVFSRPARTTTAAPRRRNLALSSYIALELAKWSLLALAAVAAFLQAIEIVERSDEFIERGMGLAAVGRYAMLRLPATLQQAMPIAALAGAMAAFSLFASRREVTAMRALGVSQWRVLLMAAPVALALGATSYALAEWVAPASQLRLASWWSSTAPEGEETGEQARWFRIEEDIVRAGSASSDGRRLRDVQVFARDAHGRLQQRLVAREAGFVAGQWSLSDVLIVRFEHGTLTHTRHDQLTWPAPLQPEDVAAFFAASPIQSAASARRALEEAAPVDRGRAAFATRVHRLGAEPLAPLVMLLLSLPLAFVPPRTGRSWPPLLYTAAGGLVYLVADGVLTVFAQVGYLPPFEGAWAAPLLFGLTATSVLIHCER